MMIKAILLDIEGTTSSIDFVHKVLFPYAHEHMTTFIDAYQHEPEVATLLDDVYCEADIPKGNISAAVTQLKLWIEADQKITPLKALQGLIWAKGYQKGDFTSHMYPDAYEVMKAWHGQGLPMYIYSSGSVKAQQLFFGHTEYGDVLSWLKGHFDTTTGPKKQVDSYHNITEAIGLPAETILFLSDVVAELDAAQQAGLYTTQLVREPGMITGQHPIAQSFYDIDLP